MSPNSSTLALADAPQHGGSLRPSPGARRRGHLPATGVEARRRPAHLGRRDPGRRRTAEPRLGQLSPARLGGPRRSGGRGSGHRGDRRRAREAAQPHHRVGRHARRDGAGGGEHRSREPARRARPAHRQPDLAHAHAASARTDRRRRDAPRAGGRLRHRRPLRVEPVRRAPGRHPRADRARGARRGGSAVADGGPRPAGRHGRPRRRGRHGRAPDAPRGAKARGPGRDGHRDRPRRRCARGCPRDGARRPRRLPPTRPTRSASTRR